MDLISIDLRCTSCTPACAYFWRSTCSCSTRATLLIPIGRVTQPYARRPVALALARSPAALGSGTAGHEIQEHVAIASIGNCVRDPSTFVCCSLDRYVLWIQRSRLSSCRSISARPMHQSHSLLFSSVPSATVPYIHSKCNGCQRRTASKFERTSRRFWFTGSLSILVSF